MDSSFNLSHLEDFNVPYFQPKGQNKFRQYAKSYYVNNREKFRQYYLKQKEQRKLNPTPPDQIDRQTRYLKAVAREKKRNNQLSQKAHEYRLYLQSLGYKVDISQDK